jgi:glycosyltransferase involved in cell wall biosynthesis
VFASPSTKEGFGLAAMEALAGVPVVANDLPVLREIFDGAADFASGTDELAWALGRALSDPAAHDAAGCALASRHTWNAAATRHPDLYRTLLGGQ